MSRLVAFSKRIEEVVRSRVRGRDPIDALLEVEIRLEKPKNAFIEKRNAFIGRIDALLRWLVTPSS